MISFLFIEPYFNSKKASKNNGEKPQVWKNKIKRGYYKQRMLESSLFTFIINGEKTTFLRLYIILRLYLSLSLIHHIELPLFWTVLHHWAWSSQKEWTKSSVLYSWFEPDTTYFNTACCPSVNYPPEFYQMSPCLQATVCKGRKVWWNLLLVTCFLNWLGSIFLEFIAETGQTFLQTILTQCSWDSHWLNRT